MKIIPVIDLLNGEVVHAKKGQRQLYQPIKSQLTSSSEPIAIVAALLALYPFNQLYIADLNAIQKSDAEYHTNYKIIETIAQHYPQLTLWVDAGISNNTDLSIWQKLKIRIVIGSENFAHIGNYCSLKHHDQNFILSLDFMPHGYQGPAELLTNTEYWPKDVIVMSLANVGTNLGINTNLVRTTLARKHDINVYAAGGIRNVDDLMTLKEMGIHGALIATSLHHKQILFEHLMALAK